MTQEEYDFIQQAYNDASELQKQKYDGKSGIYAITYKGNIIYIGKSTNLLKRFIAHMSNTLVLEAKEHNRQMYCQLRNLINCGKAPVYFTVLEYCSEQQLDEKEGQYIRKFMPPLNTRIPQEGCCSEIRKHIGHVQP